MKGIVNDDLLCIGCNYNLRTQPLDGLCPECARPVSESVAFPRLSRSAPRWLTSLIDSVTVLLVSFAVDITVLRIGPRSIELALCLAVVPWVLNWFAMWLVTRPEPGKSRDIGRGRAWALRLLATCPILLLAGRFHDPFLIGALLLSAAPAGFLYYDHLRRMAARLPAPSLAIQAGLLQWMIPIAAAFSVAYLFLGRAVGGGFFVLHLVPRPGIPGSADLSLLADALVAGHVASLLDYPIRLLGAVTTLAAIAVLVQFRLAFAQAARARRGATS